MNNVKTFNAGVLTPNCKSDRPMVGVEVGL